MKRIFYTLTIITIFIGVIGVALDTVFGMNAVTYISRIKINDVYMYKYDFWEYITNVKNTFTNVSELTLTMPTRTWQNNIDITNWTNGIANNLALILDYIIFGLNVFIYPLRIIFYAIQILLSLIGLPTIQGTYNDNPLKWLIDLCKMFVQIVIPYV